MERVTGIGGVFIKANDPAKLAAWYEKHLGIPFEKNLWVDFKWENPHNSAKPGHTVFSFFKKESDYFNPSSSPFMINFRVANLEALLQALRNGGVPVQDNTENYEYGKFGWCIDPEGNKIELWEPVDDEL